MAVSVFPLLTATLFLVFFDRYLGAHFFTTTAGGDPMMYTNLIWMWGHPEVYILMLPAFGVFSEAVSTFSRKPIASYRTNVIGMIGVSTLALSVWLHHFVQRTKPRGGVNRKLWNSGLNNIAHREVRLVR